MNADFYGLSAHPFPLSPANGSYFQSASHSNALSFIGDHLGKAASVIVITGETSSGKSMLAEHLLRTIDRHEVRAVRVEANPGSSWSLYREVALALGLAELGDLSTDWQSLLEQSLRKEAEWEILGKPGVLLVIDDAHHLSSQNLAALQNLATFELQALLLAHPDLRDRLSANFPLPQGQMVLHQLGLLDPTEVRDFVEHRLLCCGWSGDNPSIDARVFLQIARECSGLPGTINLICHDIWDYCALHNLRRIEPSLVADVLGNRGKDSACIWTRPVNQADQAAAIFALHEELIGELQKAVVELADLQNRRVPYPGRIDHGGGAELLPQILDRLSTLEAQALEQEQALKHILTMLIEWIESRSERAAA